MTEVGIAHSETEIRVLLGDWADAMRAKNAERVMSHYGDDHVQFILAPPLQYGRAQPWDRKALVAWFDTFDGALEYELRDLAITAGETVAFCRFLNRLGATSRQAGPFALWSRVTIGFEKRDGRWKIMHLHQSVPFLMDGSFAAAVDLKP